MGGLPVNLILLSSQLDLTDNTPCQLADWLIYFLRLKKPDSILASCAFGFSKHHPFTKFILDNFRQAYQPHVYPCIGPGYINEMLKKSTFYYTYLIILALIT